MTVSRSVTHNNPEVSILMVVHNGERFLQVALDSILGQTFEDFEFIVIDDASTDASPPLLDACADPRIVRHRNAEKNGLTRSLNVGLRLARGQYVARMDADDIAHHDRLALQVDFLNRHSDHVLVGSSYRLIDEHGIEVPVLALGGSLWVRISAQVYNEIEDYARLAQAVAKLR